jgi:hypothetical protein
METAHTHSIVLTLALLGTSAYVTYMISRRRQEIRKTIQVIDLKDTEFWEGLSQLRDVIPVRA